MTVLNSLGPNRGKRRVDAWTNKTQTIAGLVMSHPLSLENPMNRVGLAMSQEGPMMCRADP